MNYVTRALGPHLPNNLNFSALNHITRENGFRTHYNKSSEGGIHRLLDRKCSEFHKLGWDSNNFVYRVELAPVGGTRAESNDERPTQQQLGTAILPSSMNEVVVRISNVEALLNEDVRVENEVAAMCLMRNAFASLSLVLIECWYLTYSHGVGPLLKVLGLLSKSLSTVSS
jgi:hypothetical protein